MSNLRDDVFDKRDKNLLKAIKDMVFEPLSKQVKALSKKMDHVLDKLEHVYQSLKNKGLIEPFTKSSSLKQITKRGYKLLKDNNVEDYLNKNCELLKKNFKGSSNAQVFIKCSDWIKERGKEKLTEIMLNSNISEQDCIMLLSLFIMEKNRKNQPKTQ